MKELTEEAFRKWLRYIPSRRRFKRQSECKCPIAQYTGRRVNRFRFIDGAEEVLPGWARQFIEVFDNRGVIYLRGSFLGKGGVLRILNSMPRPKGTA